MRIIAGKYRNKKLNLPPESITRPTSQRCRESIFNILQHHPDNPLVNAHVWDVFAGSGAMGLEALSRGASSVMFVENNPKIIPFLKENIKHLNAEDHSKILQKDATELSESFSQPVDIIFMDPPYDKGLEFKAMIRLRDLDIFSKQTIMILETSKTTNLDLLQEHFTLTDTRLYGAAKVTFWQI